MHAHLKAGWQYDQFVGSNGGWRLPLNGLDRLVCRVVKGKGWQGFVIRESDGATLHQIEAGTRDEAMAAVSLRAC